MVVGGADHSKRKMSKFAIIPQQSNPHLVVPVMLTHTPISVGHPRSVDVSLLLYKPVVSQKLPTVNLTNTLLSMGFSVRVQESITQMMKRGYRVFVWLHRLVSLGFFAVLLAEDERMRAGLALACTTGMLPVVTMILFLSIDISQVLAGSYEFWFITALNVLRWACFALILRDARVLNGVKVHDQQAAPGPAAHANASLVIKILDEPEAQAHPGSAPIIPQTLEEVADPTLVHHRRGGVRLYQHRMDSCAERATTQLAAGQFFNRRRSLYLRLHHHIRNDAAARSHVYLLTLCLACMLRWHLYRSLAVFSWYLWLQWVLCQDGLMPIVKRRLRYKKRHAAPVMEMILLGLVPLLIRIFDDDSNLFVDHVVLDIRVSASHGFTLHVKAIALQRIVTILCWSMRLVHGLASTLEEEMLFIHGT